MKITSKRTHEIKEFGGETLLFLCRDGVIYVVFWVATSRLGTIAMKLKLNWIMNKNFGRGITENSGSLLGMIADRLIDRSDIKNMKSKLCQMSAR